MLPIMIIMLVTSVKDLFEDRKRYLSDKKVNNSSCRVYNYRQDKWERKCWKEVRAGDVVHLSNDEMIPADMLLLHTSDTNGYCYIDTLNLDGETNLKQREVPRGLKLAQEGKFNPKDLLANLGMCQLSVHFKLFQPQQIFLHNFIRCSFPELYCWFIVNCNARVTPGFYRMRCSNNQNLPVSRQPGAALGRADPRGQGQPAAAGVRRQEHGLRGGSRGVRRPREQGHAQQRRPALQEVTAREEDQP